MKHAGKIRILKTVEREQPSSVSQRPCRKGQGQAGKQDYENTERRDLESLSKWELKSDMWLWSESDMYVSGVQRRSNE